MFSPIPLGPLAVAVLIGVTIALAIHQFVDKEESDAKIDALGKNAGCIFLAAIVFSRMTLKLNFYPSKQHKQSPPQLDFQRYR